MAGYDWLFVLFVSYRAYSSTPHHMLNTINLAFHFSINPLPIAEFASDYVPMKLLLPLHLMKEFLCEGGLSHLPPKFEHICSCHNFFSFLLCRYFYYQLVAYCVCFKMICKKSL